MESQECLDPRKNQEQKNLNDRNTRFIRVRFIPLIIRLLKAKVKNIFYSFEILA